MNTKIKLVFNFFILAMFALILFFSVTQVFANSEGQSDHRIVILSIDTNSMVSQEEYLEKITSIVGIMSTINQGDDFYFMPMNSPGNYLGPYRAGTSNFKDFTDQIHKAISESEPNTSLVVEVDQTLGESYSLLDSESAPAGSGIYLISTNKYPIEQEYISNRIDPISDLFFDRQWHVSTFALSGIPESNINTSKTLASSTRGNTYPLDNIYGLKAFTDNLLKTSNRGNLISSGEKKLTFNDLLISDMEILPGTEYVMALFFRDENSGSLRLKNPQGLEASTGDRSSSSVLETPNTVIWVINDPIPGQWSVDVTGINGLVSSWYLTSNKYGLNFRMPEVVPTDETAIIATYITEANSLITMSDGASMTANLETPQNTSIMYKLTDDGNNGDLLSGDGYYSAAIPAPLTEGRYEVSAHLSWPGVKYKLTRNFSFEAQVFPSIEIDPIYTSNLFIGEQYTVATIYTKIKDSPYAIPSSNITPQILNDSAFGVLKINPRVPDADGKAWMYDVIFTPDKAGQTSAIFNVDFVYADRNYSRSTSNLTLESRLIPQAPIQPYSTVPYEPLPAPLPNDEPRKTKIALWMIITGIIVSVIFLITILVVLYRNSRPKPYGFLSDESNKLVLDFNNLKNRSMLKSIFARHLISGHETSLEEFSGSNFIFGKDSLTILATTTGHTIRVNNHPLVGSAQISDGTWIGATGKLFRFSSSSTYTT